MILIRREGPVSAIVHHDVGIVSLMIVSQEWSDENSRHFVCLWDRTGLRNITKEGQRWQRDVIVKSFVYVRLEWGEMVVWKAAGLRQVGRRSRVSIAPIVQVSRLNAIVVVQKRLTKTFW